MRAAIAWTSLALLVAQGAWARDAGAADCLEGISEANAHKLFDGLAKGPQRDGCELDDVQTEASQLRIVWKKDGHALEPALVLPTSCVKAPSVRGKVLSTLVPAAVDAACSTEVDALGATVASDTFGGLVALSGPTSVPDVVGRPPSRRLKFYAPFAAGGLGLLGAVSGALVWMRRRKARRASQPPKAPASV